MSASISVLVADDHAVMRDGLRSILERESDIRVVGEAADGREAVLAAKQLLPAIVVMDIVMPELNGIDATAQICQHCPDTRIVILSMLGDAEHVFRALQAGARGYLLKEMAGTEVVKAVRTVHSGDLYLYPQAMKFVADHYVRHHSAQGPLESLSSREREVLQLVVEGASSADIAAKLFLSPKSIGTYRSRIMHKLEVKDMRELLLFALAQGLISGG